MIYRITEVLVRLKVLVMQLARRTVSTRFAVPDRAVRVQHVGARGDNPGEETREMCNRCSEVS